MRRTTIAVLAAVLALAGCSASGGEAPSSTPSATPAAPTTASEADQVAACTDAIVAGEGQDGPECASLSVDDLFKAVQAANQQGRGALQSAIASSSAAAQ